MHKLKFFAEGCGGWGATIGTARVATYKVERSPNGGLQVFKQIVGLLIK